MTGLRVGMRTDARRVSRHSGWRNITARERHSRLPKSSGQRAARARRDYPSEKRVELPARAADERTAGVPATRFVRGGVEEAGIGAVRSASMGQQRVQVRRRLAMAEGRLTAVTRRAFEDE
jgi:hypothetical protein